MSYKLCPICKKPYEIHSHTAADQSMCSECLTAAQKAVKRNSNDAEKEKRRTYFGE